MYRCVALALLVGFSAGGILLPRSVHAEPPVPRPGAVLLFADDFDRPDSPAGQEQIEQGWRTNSKSRAQGNVQVTIQSGQLHIARHPVADHGVSLAHAAEFQDGIVELRFQLRPGDDLGIDFADLDLKTVHAGHLCIARINLKSLTLQDSKSGVMDLNIRERRLAGDKSPELTAIVNQSRKQFPVTLKPGQWYTFRVVLEEDTLQAFLDGELIGQFASPGIAHQTKKMIRLAFNKDAIIDDVRIWKLK